MGTRHLQTVIAKNGETKVNQYGQWDGYPSGQGIEILKYLRSGNLVKYQENLEKLDLITDSQMEEVNKDPNRSKNYPYLSRDCGSDIHQMIQNGEVKFVCFIDTKEAESWCEGFYTIDFSKNEFTSRFYDKKKTFKLDKLPTVKRYLKLMEPKE